MDTKPQPLALNESGIVQCKTLEDSYRFANAIVKSGLAPASFKTPEQVLVACQMGAELGMRPLQALNSIYVFNGRPALYAKAQLGIVLSSGLCVGYRDWDEGQGENLVVHVELKRHNPHGEPLVKTARFSWQDARRAQLAAKGTYSSFPRDMLLSRALTRALALFNDVLGGMPAVETLQDAGASQVKNVTPPAAPDPLMESAGIEVVTPRQGEAEGQTAPAPVTTPPVVIDVSPAAESDGRAPAATAGDGVSPGIAAISPAPTTAAAPAAPSDPAPEARLSGEVACGAVTVQEATSKKGKTYWKVKVGQVGICCFSPEMADMLRGKTRASVRYEDKQKGEARWRELIAVDEAS